MVLLVGLKLNVIVIVQLVWEEVLGAIGPSKEMLQEGVARATSSKVIVKLEVVVGWLITRLVLVIGARGR